MGQEANKPLLEMFSRLFSSQVKIRARLHILGHQEPKWDSILSMQTTINKSILSWQTMHRLLIQKGSF